ncbi:IMP dehydrogenase [candidate division WWE3 bacterium]|uniref:IMP dehydrogenase n=1 Tax=candidate division WWE3 bacterium TaxID=2053526 RepID=A0A955LG06_UNCKA|nr:IMP dehydrogenase [candidate division WWE3 bacterium]
MPRINNDQQPNVINCIQSVEEKRSNILEIATTNKNKLAEFQRIFSEYTVVGVKLSVDEIQSLDPYEVVREKAKVAWQQNGCNPVLVEDTSLEIRGLADRPGVYVNDFFSEVEIRRLAAEKWLKDADRRAVARVLLAIYDGVEAHIFEGTVDGSISEDLRGTNGFGWDDFFIPAGQPNSESKTFAEMTDDEKDTYSMRNKAAHAFRNSNLKLAELVYELPEPLDSEMLRVQTGSLGDSGAVDFAFRLEGIEDNNTPNANFEATAYTPIIKEQNDFYRRYVLTRDSASLGVVVTDVDRAKSLTYQNGEPRIWQMGPQRRRLALAQRAEYWLRNIQPDVLTTLEKLENGTATIPQRSNRKSVTVEHMLKMIDEVPLEAHALKELGYKKLSSTQKVSRTTGAQFGLFNKIGKHYRSFLGIGSMPAISGWRDVIVTSIVGNMPVFISRNNIFAENESLRISLVSQVQKVIDSLAVDDIHKQRLRQNIGVAIGASDVSLEIERVNKFVKQGVKMFRIYTINSDPRVIEVASGLRREFGDEIEIFAGQIADKKQAKRLIDEARVDGLIFGHGGGRQCTSAVNGMAITTLEEIYAVVTDSYFNDVSVIAEGGVGKNIGPLLILGVDAVLYSQQLARGTIECGGVFLQDREGDFGQPYHGSASAPTMIIEAANERLKDARLTKSGRTKVPEGKPGFLKYTEKANSMTFWIDEFRHHLARTLADIGVKDIAEMRTFLSENDEELLRVVSSGAASIAQAYGAS